MHVVPMAQPGLVLESDSPTAPSEAGGGDFATLMAAMAAACLAPAPTPVLPLTGHVAGGTPDGGDTGSVDAGAVALLPAFGWAACAPAATPAAGAGETPAGPASDGPAPGSFSGSGPAPGSPGGAAAVQPSLDPAVAFAALDSEAVGGMPEIPGGENGATRDTTGAKLLPPAGASAGLASVPVTGHPSFMPAEAAGESDTGEAGSKPIAAAPGHDRFGASGVPASGTLMAAEATRAADAPSGSASVQDPPVVDQVVSVVEPLRHRGDGHHELTLDLRPAELGAIRVEVSIDQGTVHLSLHADEASTGTLLHQAMPELRAALEEAGLVAGRLGVGPGDREGGRPPAQSRPTEGDEPTAGRPKAAAAATIRPPVAPAAGALDLLL
jgi:flagellar hook-length control protein FliK